MSFEERTARFTVMIDPHKKAVFEHLCAREDVTPSQVVRKLIRDYIEQKLGQPWVPGDTAEKTLSKIPAGTPRSENRSGARVTDGN